MTPSLKDELQMTKGFDSVQQEAILSVLRTESLLSNHINTTLRQNDLSQPLYNILRILKGAGTDGTKVQDIACRMISPVPDTTRLIDRLEQKGLASRTRSKEDRRVVRVVISKKGAKLLQKVDPAMRAINKKLVGHMKDKDLTKLNSLLSQVREALQDDAK
jgi:DNA-binding MarR family transcriptional regulator